MPVPTQLASLAAWSDEAHVTANRRLYQQKFDRVLPILRDVLPLTRPAGGFYLWPHVNPDDAAFTRALYQRTHLTVLPGTYLARDSGGGNPGRGRVRISLVPTLDQCIDAAQRLRDFIADG
jgi:N-succinyldiaminopimelate aminotransferase